jgi:hypothetical protein
LLRLSLTISGVDTKKTMAAAGRFVGGAGSAVALTFVLGACGGTSLSQAEHAQSAAMTPYLARAGEVTGYSPKGAPKFVSSAATWADTSAQAKRLEGEGFQAVLQENTAAVDGQSGTSWVELLASHAAALSEVAAQAKADVAALEPGPITRFDVPGVPTAQGAAARSTKGGAANVAFVEGSCVLLVGIQAASGANPSPPVIAGARKLYDRTVHSVGVCTKAPASP